MKLIKDSGHQWLGRGKRAIASKVRALKGDHAKRTSEGTRTSHLSEYNSDR